MADDDIPFLNLYPLVSRFLREFSSSHLIHVQLGHQLGNHSEIIPEKQDLLMSLLIVLTSRMYHIHLFLINSLIQIVFLKMIYFPMTLLIKACLLFFIFSLFFLLLSLFVEFFSILFHKLYLLHFLALVLGHLILLLLFLDFFVLANFHHLFYLLSLNHLVIIFPFLLLPYSLIFYHLLYFLLLNFLLLIFLLALIYFLILICL